MRDLSLLTWKEVKEINKRKSIVFVVLAPIEEYGTHLPLATDIIEGEYGYIGAPRYTRGQFAVMGNVGRKALRLYHEEGILVPVYINEENGYHYYDESQLETLEKIKKFRKIGLSLFEIKQILDGKVDETEIIDSKISEAFVEA